jgi:quinol monooxygenase YgiN
MIRTVLTLRVAPERVAEVVEMYKQQDILQHSLDLTEALRSELSVATDGSGVVMVTAVWPSVEAYQAWLDNPRRHESNDRLNTVLRSGRVASGETFSIVQSVSKN